MRTILTLALILLPFVLTAAAQDNRIDTLKAEVTQKVEDNKKMVQEIVDSLFSFSELGFQEYETQRYVSDLLEKK